MKTRDEVTIVEGWALEKASFRAAVRNLPGDRYVQPLPGVLGIVREHSACPYDHWVRFDLADTLKWHSALFLSLEAGPIADARAVAERWLAAAASLVGMPAPAIIGEPEEYRLKEAGSTSWNGVGLHASADDYYE